MQRFEITIDGTAQAGDYATREEALEAARTVRLNHGDRSVNVRAKADVLATGKSVPPGAATGPTVTGSEQGTPGNPAGREQR